MRYIKYLAENFDSYLRARLTFIGVILFLIVLIFTVEFSIHRNIDQYNFVTIKVNKVAMDSYLDFPNARYDYRESISIQALKIGSVNDAYYVDRDFKEYWAEIMTEIQPGDSVQLWYLEVDSYFGNRNRLLHIMKEGETLLDINENKAFGRVFSYYLYFALTFFVFALSSLLYFRRKFKRRIN